MQSYASRLWKGLVRLLVEIDIFANVILGGDLGETISRRAARNMHIPVWGAVAWMILKFDPDHFDSYQ